MSVRRMVFWMALLFGAATAWADVTLTGTDAEVVVAADDSPVVRFAATEMTNFLSRAFGRAVPLVTAPTAGRQSILLGRAGASSAGVDVAGFARDEFAVRTTSDGVAVFGRDDSRRDPAKELVAGGAMRFERGTLFGVYGFLERYVGCRFYFPGELGEVVPRRTSVMVDGDWTVKPVFAVRRWYEGPKSVWYEGGADEPKLRARNVGLSILRLRMETELVPCCHGQNAFRYLERFGKTHPEYFTKLSDGTRFTHPIGGHACSKFGQICYSSGAMEELYQDVKAYLTGEPASSRGLKDWGHNCVGGKYVDIMANDAFLPCRCGVCETRFSKTDPVQYATEMVWGETVKIANRLTAEGVKGYVTQMAYNPYRRIPDFDIPTNVLVMVAATGPWARGEKRRSQKDMIRGWAEKLGRPVWVWTYPGKFAPQEFPGIPHQTPRALGEFYRDVRPWIFGSFLNADSDSFLFSHLNFYMYSRIAWDAEADVDLILDEYYRLMFGPAAAEFKAFFGELEDLWIDRIVGNVIDTNLGPVAKPPSEDAIWRTVYSPEKLRAWRTSLEAGFAKCPSGSLEARRVRLMTENFLGSLERQSKAYFDARAKVEAFRYPSAAFPDAMRLVKFKSKGKRFTPVETSVRIVRRADDLVVTYDCAEPDLPRTRCARLGHDHHDLWKNNGVEFHLNVSGDRRAYYQFIVTQAGELTDTRVVQSGTGGGMPEFDFGWESGAKVSVAAHKDGWTAEVVIPCASFLEKPLAAFPANFCRSRVLDDDTFDLYSWSPYVLGYHDPLNFGTVSP